MGWYEHPNHRNVMVGDDAFDVTHAFLVNLAEIYRSEFERNPTLAELTTLVGIALRTSGTGLVEDLATKQVTAVVAKTRPKPRDQRYAIGDVFAIPLRKKFAFGRIMANTPLGLLVEIFREPRATSMPPALPKNVERLFPPVYLSSRAFKSWRWTIVRSDASYKMPLHKRPIEFAGHGPDGWCVMNRKGQILRKLDEAKGKTMERLQIWDPAMLEARVKTLL